MPTIITLGTASLKAFGFAGRSTVTYDSDAAAYFTACTIQPDTARKGFINTLVVGLKADSLWTKIDWLLLLASQDYASTKQASRVNLRNPAKVATQSGTVNYSAIGTTSNGTNGYFDLGENFNAAGNQFTQNSSFLLTHVSAGSGTHLDVGASTGANTVLGSANSSVAEKSRLMQASDNSYTNTSPGGKTGTRIITRTSSTAMTLDKDATTVKTFSVASTSSSGSGGTKVYSGSTLSFFASGGGLTVSETAALSTRVSDFLTAIGAA